MQLFGHFAIKVRQYTCLSRCGKQLELRPIPVPFSTTEIFCFHHTQGIQPQRNVHNFLLICRTNRLANTSLTYATTSSSLRYFCNDAGSGFPVSEYDL